MSVRQIRLNSVITLENEQEKDIIELVDRLNSTHKMGEFVTVLLRLACDCPEVLEKRKGRFESGELTKLIHKQGMSQGRLNTARELAEKVVDMRNKVDFLYNEILKMSTALEMGNRLGIKERVDNSVLASFIVRKQIEQLQKELGFGGYGVFKADVEKAHMEKVDEIMEYIVTTYANEIEALGRMVKQASVSTGAIMNGSMAEAKPFEAITDKNEAVVSEQKAVASDNESKDETVHNSDTSSDAGKDTEEGSEDDELIIDDTSSNEFDASLLAKFFG